MATRLRLKNVDQRTILIVNGYIRNIQKVLSHLIIPNEIVDECIAFCMPLLWDLSALKQENSSIIKLPLRSGNRWKTIVLTECITNEICYIFEIEVTQIKANSDKTCNGCFLGFIKNSIDNLERDKALSRNIGSVAIKVYQTSLWYINYDQSKRKQIKCLSRYFTEGDKLTMSINFNEENCKWFWNNEQITVVMIDSNVIFPAFSPFWQSNEYKITNFHFS